MKMIIAVMAIAFGAAGQSGGCLRVMTPEELTQKAVLIARIKVSKTERVNYYGMYGQLATVAPVDVIDGDDRLAQVNVLARSTVQCAEDAYSPKQEMLVFLGPEGSLLKTVNFQYGQFPIVGEVVKNWRDKNNQVGDKAYTDVRKEIEAYVSAARTPPKPKPEKTEKPDKGDKTDRPDKPNKPKPNGF